MAEEAVQAELAELDLNSTLLDDSIAEEITGGWITDSTTGQKITNRDMDNAIAVASFFVPYIDWCLGSTHLSEWQRDLLWDNSFAIMTDAAIGKVYRAIHTNHASVTDMRHVLGAMIAYIRDKLHAHVAFKHSKGKILANWDGVTRFYIDVVNAKGEKAVVNLC